MDDTLPPRLRAPRRWHRATQRVVRRHERAVVVTREGDELVLVSAEELAELEAARETAEVLANPDLVEQLREADEAIAAGQVFSVDEVRAELERGGEAGE